MTIGDRLRFVRKAWPDGNITDDEYFAWKMEYDLSDELMKK